ncbi:hypothetical protein ACFX13_028465 [Malus domestica]
MNCPAVKYTQNRHHTTMVANSAEADEFESVRPRVVRISITDGNATDSSIDDEAKESSFCGTRHRVKRIVNEITIESCSNRDTDSAVWRSRMSRTRRKRSSGKSEGGNINLMNTSCRNKADEERLQHLKDKAVELKVDGDVEFHKNVLYKSVPRISCSASFNVNSNKLHTLVIYHIYRDLVQLLGGAITGIHSMTDEHFGISVVEYMAAGAIPIGEHLKSYPSFYQQTFYLTLFTFFPALIFLMLNQGWMK